MNTRDSHLKIAPSNWPRGSDWRRWDLHVHTPESQLGTPFCGSTWDEYINVLEEKALESKIAVIGVTDYMSIDGYEKLVEEKNVSDRLKSVDLIIPNIEFRIMPNTKSGKALNLHFLINPSDSDHIDRIKRALKNLKLEYNNESYGCCRDELIEFGRIQNPNLTDDNDAYKYGISQFKPDRTVIKNWFDKEMWLRNSSLVGVANGQDGVSGLPLDGFGAIRDELLKWCDFVFSANPSDRKHYLGYKEGVSKDDIIRQYRSLKPCVHGSDAHDIDSLFKPDGDRFCWIKGDPTFDGLRQILWEPEGRIYVGPQPPQPSDQSQLIRKITFSETSDWFDTESIDLNPGLVAIIGEKGSGKTAIVDLAAFAAGVKMDPKSQSSFITKGRVHLSGMKVELEWGSNETTDGTLTDGHFASTHPKVRYLSQDFVERLCSTDYEGTELREAIEGVVFSKLDEIQKEGYSSFRSLRSAQEVESNTKREAIRGAFATLHKEIERLQESFEQRGVKVEEKKEIGKQVKELEKQIPDATLLVNKMVLKNLESEQVLLRKVEDEISSITRKQRIIKRAIESYVAIKGSTSQEIIEVQRQLIDAGIGEGIVKALPPAWSPDVEKFLYASVENLSAEIEMRKGKDGDEDNAQSIVAIKKKITKLKEKVANDEVSRNRLLNLQKQIREKIATSERLEREINNLNKNVSKEIQEKKQKQINLYLQIFDELKHDEESLRDLYVPMEKAIRQLGDEMQFSVSVGYQTDVSAWLNQLSSFFDGRRIGANAKHDEIKKVVETQLVQAWKGGDSKEIKDALTCFINTVEADTFLSQYGTPNLSKGGYK